MTCWPITPDSFSATTRASTSTPPPGDSAPTGVRVGFEYPGAWVGVMGAASAVRPATTRYNHPCPFAPIATSQVFSVLVVKIAPPALIARAGGAVWYLVAACGRPSGRSAAP